MYSRQGRRLLRLAIAPASKATSNVTAVIATSYPTPRRVVVARDGTDSWRRIGSQNQRQTTDHDLREVRVSRNFFSTTTTSTSKTTTTAVTGKHPHQHRYRRNNINGNTGCGVKTDQPKRDAKQDESHTIRLSLTRRLLQQEDFAKWDHIIASATNKRNANIDTLLRDYWGRYLDGNRRSATLDDLVLFSDLCMRVLERASSSDLRLRVLQQALVAWTGAASCDTSETALQRARELFDAVPPPPKNHENRRATDLKIRTGLYRLLFLVYSRSNHPDAAKRCYALLEQLLREDRALTKPTEAHTQTETTNNIHPHNRRGSDQNTHTIASQTAFHWTMRAAAKRGDDHLFRLVRSRMHQEGWDDTAITYDCLLQLIQTIDAQSQPPQWNNHHHHHHYARRQRVKRETLRTWQQLLQHYRQDPSPQWQPLPSTLGKVLLLHKDDPQLSLQILTDAIVFVRDYPSCQSMVDGPVMRLVLLTMVKHRRPSDADRIARYMLEAYNQGNASLKPTSDHFCLLIRVHVEAGDLRHAKEYLDWMKTSGSGDLPTYNTYLRGLLDHREDPVPDMEEIIEQMSNPSKGQATVPNLTTYLTLMNGWVKSKRPAYVKRVDEIFRLARASMLNQGEMSDEIYGVVIDAWARSRLPEAADRCRDIWNEIPHPTQVHYNILLKAYALSRLPEEAEALFREMVKETNVQIDHISFNTAILAWSIAGNANRALALVNFMVTNTQQIDFFEASTIDSILRSDPCNASKTATMLWGMLYDLELGHRQDLLLPIIECLGKQDSVTAWNALQECLEITRTHRGTSIEILVPVLVSALRHVFDDGVNFHEDYLTKLFQICSNGGHVNQEILEAFRRYAPPKVYRRLTMQDPRRTCDMEMIPELWRRNLA